MKERISVYQKIKTIVGQQKQLQLLLMISIIQIPIALVATFIYRIFIDEVLLKRRISLLVMVIAWYIIEYVIVFLLERWKVTNENKLYNNMKYNLRRKILHNYIFVSNRIYKDYGVGDLKMRIDDDVDVIESFYRDQIINCMIYVVKIISYGIVMICISPYLMILAILMLPITYLLGQMVGKREMKINGILRELYSDKYQWQYNSLQNWKEIKNFSMQKREKMKFTGYYHKIGKLNAKWIFYWLMHSLVIPAVKDEVIMRFALYVLGGILIILNKLSIGSLLVFISCYEIFFDQVNKMNSLNVDLKNISPILQRVLEVIELQEDKVGKVYENFSGNIRVEHLSYAYKDQKDYVLEDVSFEINCGETIAVVGRSGVGKSTLAKLMAGILGYQQGRILYDGIDLNEIDANSVYRNVCIVMQDSLLFNLSILDNLIFGAENITQDRLDEICRKVNLYEFIQELPNQYDTLIGEGGVKLSGGQRQRLIIARALLSNAKIIIFDEATSSLDSLSDQIIRQTIREFTSEVTFIIIAHRLSSITEADRVIVLKDRRLVAYDQHEKLRGNVLAYDELFV